MTFPPVFVDNGPGPNGEQLDAATLNAAFTNAKGYVDTNALTEAAGDGRYVQQNLTGLPSTVNVGGRAVEVTVASSSTPGFALKGVDQTASGVIGTNGAGVGDEYYFAQAWSTLKGSGDGTGKVKALAGPYYFGTNSTSYFDIANTNGGVMFEGSGRRVGSQIVIADGAAAPAAVFMRAVNGSHTYKEIYITGTGSFGGNCAGVWMQSNQGTFRDAVCGHVPGTGFIFDKGISAITDPVNAPAGTGTATSGSVIGCEAFDCGSGVLASDGSGVPADGFLVNNQQNANFYGCFAAGLGDTVIAAAIITTGLAGSTHYTTVTTGPTTGIFTDGDLAILVNTAPSGIAFNNLTNYRIVKINNGTTGATLAKGSTTITVDGPTASRGGGFTTNSGETYGTGTLSYIARLAGQITRIGFNIQQNSHLTSCHPYFCHMVGLYSWQCCVEITGGEYENNAYANILLRGSTIWEVGSSHTTQTAAIKVVSTLQYGNPVAAAMWMQNVQGGVIFGNLIDAGVSTYGINAQNCVSTVFMANVVFNGVGGTNIAVAIAMRFQSCSYINVTKNQVKTLITSTGASTVYGYSIFACTNSQIEGNMIESSALTALVQWTVGGTNTATRMTNNQGYNPVGSIVISVPASSGGVIAAAVYDRLLYATADPSGAAWAQIIPVTAVSAAITVTTNTATPSVATCTSSTTTPVIGATISGNTYIPTSTTVTSIAIANGVITMGLSANHTDSSTHNTSTTFSSTAGSLILLPAWPSATVYGTTTSSAATLSYPAGSPIPNVGASVTGQYIASSTTVASSPLPTSTGCTMSQNSSGAGSASVTFSAQANSGPTTTLMLFAGQTLAYHWSTAKPTNAAQGL